MNDISEDKNKQLREENKQLKTELEKAQCCGSCRWWSYFVEEEGIETCCVISGVYGIWPSYCCDQWEVRE